MGQTQASRVDESHPKIFPHISVLHHWLFLSLQNNRTIHFTHLFKIFFGGRPPNPPPPPHNPTLQLSNPARGVTFALEHQMYAKAQTK